MALHLTKVAFGAASVEHLVQRLEARAVGGTVALTTRYLPKRHGEIAGQGSLYWIIKHQLVARSPILAFEPAEGGRTAIIVAGEAIRLQPVPRRAHQGWRYLEAADAPPDLGADGVADMAALPPALIGELAALALI